MNFRHGQWVLFSAVPELKDATHQTPDGLMVGIYQRGGHDPLGTETPDHVKPVGPDGGDIRRINGAQVETASLNPALLENLQPLLEREHVPAKRLATMHAEWHPLEWHQREKARAAAAKAAEASSTATKAVAK